MPSRIRLCDSTSSLDLRSGRDVARHAQHERAAADDVDAIRGETWAIWIETILAVVWFSNEAFPASGCASAGWRRIPAPFRFGCRPGGCL